MRNHNESRIGMSAFWGILFGMVCTFILALVPNYRIYAVYALLTTPLLSSLLTALELILKGIYAPGISLLAAVVLVIVSYLGGNL